MKGVVMKSTGSWYDVLGVDQQIYKCRIRGKFRLDESKETNPVAVGDYVVLAIESNENTIEEILPRDNFIVRQSVKRAGHTHVLAANIDQVMLIATLAMPRTSLGFIDRFIVAAESFRIPQIIVFNKADLLDNDEKQEVDELINLYTSLNIQCLLTSIKNEEQQDIIQLLNNKKTLIAGHSGVGKSTLLNKLATDIDQKTSSISDFSSKGTHTTTFAEMFQLHDTTFIIDTPGIKELGLVDMQPEEISDYFVEMRALRSQCKFGARCLHISEPKCAVQEALNLGSVAQSRYDSYVSMVKNEDNRR